MDDGRMWDLMGSKAAREKGAGSTSDPVGNAQSWDLSRGACGAVGIGSLAWPVKIVQNS
jgi:hypothetical protein